MQSSFIRKSITVLFAMILALGSFALLGCSGETSQEGGASSGSETVAETEDATIEVTVTIDISAAIAEEDPIALELEKTQGAEYTMQVVVPEGTTVMEALEASGVDITTTSSGAGSYVSGINGLHSGSVGPESGWTFYINGEFAMDAADVATVSEGDTVLWQFVTSFE